MKSRLLPARVAKRAWMVHLLEAGFAQPSGIATDGKNLYVADSESNIIRAIDLDWRHSEDARRRRFVRVWRC